MSYRFDWLLDCEPRPVQLEAVSRSFCGTKVHEDKHDEPIPEQLHGGQIGGWAHYLETRLGKTITLLNEALLMHQAGLVHNVMVVAPSTYVEAWHDEAIRFGADATFAPFIVKLNKYEKAIEEIESPRSSLIVIHYEALGSPKFDEIVAAFRRVKKPWLMACDESILLKNPKGLYSVAAINAGKHSTYQRALSGRPFTQGPHDLYMQLFFLRANRGMNFFSFRNKFCQMGGFKGKKIIGQKNADQLGALLRTCSFRAKRKDWANVEQPEFVIDQIPMEDEQKRVYDEMNSAMITMVDENTVSAANVLVRMAKMQQISSGFLYDEDRNLHQIIAANHVPKLVRTLEILEELDEKVVIVYHYSFSGELLTEKLKKFNPTFLRTGKWMKDRGLDVETEKKKFNSDHSHRVMLVQSRSGKYGHDLTGMPDDVCRTMIFYENTYSLDTRFQLEQRITTQNVDAGTRYFDFVDGSTSRACIDALIKKEDCVTAVLGSYGFSRWGNLDEHPAEHLLDIEDF